MRAALDLIRQQGPDFEVDGEMNGESALVPAFRQRVYPHSRLTGEANVLIMPNIEAANIAYQMIKVLADALPVGPILIGAARPAHILTPSVTARGIVNMTAVAAVEAQQAGQREEPLGVA
jgi:malate dehydrogenase (oxaloacetate-decarboxylating)(NADP+)